MWHDKSVLVVVAHPDDVVLGCSGLICKLKSLGCTIHLCYLSGGYNGRAKRTKMESYVETVANRLGTTSFEILDFQSSKFDQYHQSVLNDAIYGAIVRTNAEIVLTHDSNDLHNDHLMAFKGVMVGCRYKPTSTVKQVLTFPVISSSDISPTYKFKADLYTDITEYIDFKCNLMKVYKEEFEAMPKKRGGEHIKIHAAYWGSHINVDYAEPFKIIRLILN